MAELSVPRLAMHGVSKRFGAVTALAGVSLALAPGEVHALVGENGAGKSTLMKILAGALAADGGRLELDGQPYAPLDPLAARRAGVAMIHQELTLSPDLRVAENVMLGCEEHRFGMLRRAAMRARVQRALDVLEHPEITPERPLSELGPGARQLVEVARALVADARVVVMDEPTSSLAHADVARLFEVIARLSTRGVSVIYISHALEEVERVASRYTVLRDGASVASGALAGTTRAQIIEAMVGRKLGDAFPPRTSRAFGEPVLELREVSGATLPESASLSLRRGEILGIAGLVGAGRSELLRAVYGLDPLARGDIRIANQRDRGAPPWVRLAQGVGLLSEQRKEEGLALTLSIAENMTLAAPEKCSRYGFIVRSRQRALAETQRRALDVRCRDVTQPVGSLSGGNQQKVALARLLCCDADILLLDEPTRGIDIGSKLEIYKRIAELARAGKAVLMVSSYLPELLGVCDTLAVMRRGRLGPARPIGEWSEAAVMREATGA